MAVFIVIRTFGLKIVIAFMRGGNRIAKKGGENHDLKYKQVPPILRRCAVNLIMDHERRKL